MRKYDKLITLSSILLLLIVVITLAMVYDMDLFLFKNLSIAGVKEKKMAVDELIQKQTIEEFNNLQAKQELNESKNDFDVAKEAYESIDDSTIAIVQQATKEDKYFIEYLWVVLGNYAKTNNVGIDVITPNSTVVSKEEDETEDTEETEGTKKASEQTTKSTETTNKATTNTEKTQNSTTQSRVEALKDREQMTQDTTKSSDDGIKIVVVGRYANVADFVFDVENDKSLKFKLDNIKMEYAGDNQVQATFDVLSLDVLQ